MTEEEFIEVYGEAKVIFTYYYKYAFSFEGAFKDKTIKIVVGGGADHIYNIDVEPDKEYQVKELCISYASVKDQFGNICDIMINNL